MVSRVFGLATTVLALGLAVSASGQTTIYNTFGPGWSYDSGDAWSVDPTQSLAMEFNVSSTVNLYSISLALWGGNYSLSLTTDGGGQPGTVLDSWNTSAAAGNGAIVTVTPNMTDVLTAGNYYVLAQSSDFGAWDWNSTGYTAAFLFSYNGTWYSDSGDTTGVMNVQVTPEPAPVAALGVGMLGLLIRRRRKA